MRSLAKSLHDHELIVLRVIGEWWELDLTGADKAESVQALTERLGALNLEQEIQYIPPEEMAALRDLLAAGGRIPVAAFERRHGEVRLMGPGRLEREEPWFDPASPAEALWYRGFLYRGFDETAEGLLEFYYLADEMLAQWAPPLKPPVPSAQVGSILNPVTPPKKVNISPTDAVDDLTTLLAVAQRTSLQAEQLDKLPALLLQADVDRRSLLINLAREMGLLRQGESGIRPTRAAISWLQSSREQELRALSEAWSESGWNDLCHIPALRCEGDEWHNDPLLGRTAFLEGLPQTPEWYTVADLAAWYKNENPDFQRPDGNYDTWYIRDEQSDSYLNGFESWDKVEGRLLQFYIQGPLTWLGLADTGFASQKLCYRLTDRALEWFAKLPAAPDEVKSPLQIQSDAIIFAAHHADRYARFQVARISEAAPVVAGRPYQYRITPRSLQLAGEEGITPERILQFLSEVSDLPLPPSTRRCITRWAERGVEARLEEVVVLRVGDVEILETLRHNPKTRDLIDQSLGELAAMVRKENWRALQAAAAQLGLLLDVATEDPA